MTRDEIAITALRFQRMHEYFRRLIETDPKNAPFYEIFIDHYKHQSLALNRSLEDMKAQSPEADY
jgi:hypothetical protein